VPQIRVSIAVHNVGEHDLQFRFYSPCALGLGSPEMDRLPEGRRQWRFQAGLDLSGGLQAGCILAPLTGEAFALCAPASKQNRWDCQAYALPICEWTAPKTTLAPGRSWRTDYTLVYLRSTDPSRLKADLEAALVRGPEAK
jgi:hypothetical protein